MLVIFSNYSFENVVFSLEQGPKTAAFWLQSTTEPE